MAIVPNFFKLDEEIESAKEYVSKAIVDRTSVQPTMTFYQQEKSVFTVIFPKADSKEQRYADFSKVAWLNGNMRATGIRFVCDSAIPLKTESGEEYNQDVILIFFANKMGCFVNPKCYVFSQDTQSIQWVDKDIDDKIIMNSQPIIINMLASQFFFSIHTLIWGPYVEMLEESGFVFEYHEGFDANLVEYAQATLY